MEPENQTGDRAAATSAQDHVAGAHSLLKDLQSKLGEHPELAQAITKLEMALSILTVNTAATL
jgi:hypothetical protein